MKEKQTFAGIMATVPAPHDPLNVFGDFVSLMAYSLGHANDPEPLPLERLLGDYGANALPIFPKLINALGHERAWRRKRGLNPDILGEYYMVNFGVRLMPWDECQELAAGMDFPDGTFAVDHACGSGRLLLALAERFGTDRKYCGVETDSFLAKMAAVTLFCNGIWHGEVVYADMGQGPTHFGGGWKLSADPEGVFPILRAEDSKVWELHVEEVRASKPGSPQLRFW